MNQVNKTGELIFI